jgi:hypothetical protein
MNSTTTPPADQQQAAVTGYQWFCCAGLFVLTLGLLQRKFGAWGLFPGTVGLVVLMLRWHSGPILFLASLTWLILADSLGQDPLSLAAWARDVVLRQLLPLGNYFEPASPGFWSGGGRARPNQGMPLADLLLSAGTLGYLAGYYRVLSMIHHVLPIDPRKRQPADSVKPYALIRRPPVLHQRRLAPKSLQAEFLLLATALPLLSLLAQFGWNWLSRQSPAVDLRPTEWHAVLLVWGLGFGFVVVSGCLSCLARQRQTVQGAEQLLQDVVWNETRREQRLVASWLAWARRRRQQRKDRS